MKVLVMLVTKYRISSSTWVRVNVLIFLMLSLGHPAGGVETGTLEEDSVKQELSPQRTDQTSPPIKIPQSSQEQPLQAGSEKPNAADAETLSITEESVDIDESVAAAEPEEPEIPIRSDTIIKPSLPELPNATELKSPEIVSPTDEIIPPSDKQQNPDEPSSPTTLFRGLKSYKANALSLPPATPKISQARVNLETEISSQALPDSMFVPHVYNSQGRQLVRTLRNIPRDVRAKNRFYQALIPLKRYRRIPKPNVTAWNQNLQELRYKTRPKGKPANGFLFISSVFGTRPNPFGRGTEFHNGIDLVGAKGIPILATGAGKVMTRGRGRGYGIHVVVDHGSGYQTLYAHLSKKRVKPNQKVKRGQIIGYLGSTGRSTGPHLHYSIYRDRQAVDPRPYMYK